jgi:hypothetical protein
VCIGVPFLWRDITTALRAYLIRRIPKTQENEKRRIAMAAPTGLKSLFDSIMF